MLNMKKRKSDQKIFVSNNELLKKPFRGNQ